MRFIYVPTNDKNTAWDCGWLIVSAKWVLLRFSRGQLNRLALDETIQFDRWICGTKSIAVSVCPCGRCTFFSAIALLPEEKERRRGSK